MAAKQDSNSRPRKNRTQQDNKPQKERFPLPFEACFLHDSFGAGVLRQLLFGFSLFSVPPAGRLRAPPGSPHRDGAQGSPCRSAIPRSQSGTSIPEHTPAPKRPAKSQPDPRTKPRAETPYQATAPKRHAKPRAGMPYQATAPKCHAKPRAGMPYRNTSSIRCTAFAKPQTGRSPPSSTKNKQSLVPVRRPEKLSSGAACKIVE